MKKQLLSGIVTLVAMLFAITVDAQQMKIGNGSNCTMIFYAAAEDGGCSTYSTNTYTLGPGASMLLDMSDPTQWSGGLPPAGSNWSFVKMGSPSGPYVAGTAPCTSPVTNGNVMVIGTPCGFTAPVSSCMKHSACGTLVYAKWYTYLPSPDVKVLIQ